MSESTIKLEYCDGVIYAMAGGTVAHGQLSVNIASALKVQTRTTCAVLSSDVKVRIDATDLTTFPDASVVCGKVKTASQDRTAITNPSVLVEVTSPSTEDYDRGDKLSHYKQLASVKTVIFVSHRRPELTVVSRRGRKWIEETYRAGEAFSIDEPEVSLNVDDVYEGVALD
ncbi:MAG: Uma2 family endonuclease [Archangium sp.]|nr:Uma2 family endonuclease [Archangium sp.]